MGLRQIDFVGKSQSQIRSIFEGRRGLAAFDIDPITKKLLTTDENYALAAQIVAQCEESLDMNLVSPGRDWILELEARAYRLGSNFQVGMYRSMGRKLRAGIRGIDATTLKLIRKEAYKQIVGLKDDQIEYIRTVLTKGVIENRTYQGVQKMMIHDGKIPALVVNTKTGPRLIEMETRIESIVRTEMGKIAEQGTRDKASEIYGTDELFMRWHTILDGRERKSHRARHGEIRSVTAWQNEPHPSDGKTSMPSEETNCRCWGEYGSEEELKMAA